MVETLLRFGETILPDEILRENYQKPCFVFVKEFVMTNERKREDVNAVWKLEPRRSPLKLKTSVLRNIACASLGCHDALKTSRRRCSGNPPGSKGQRAV